MDLLLRRDLADETGDIDQAYKNLALTLERIEHLDIHVLAFMPERARAERLRLDLAESSTGPLLGTILGVKDIFAVDGLPTTGGSRIDPEALRTDEAVVVSDLRRLGCLVVGKTRTAEFAGPQAAATRNPHDLARTPGGSSSGSAAAVAAGMVPAAIGTQTIGSVIRPASYCGVVGFKTTVGAVSLEGALPCARSYDSLGTFTTTVRSARMLAGQLLAPQGLTRHRPINQTRIALADGSFLRPASHAARSELEKSRQRLSDLGAEVALQDLFGDLLEEIVAAQSRIFSFEFALAYAPIALRHPERIGPKTADLIGAGSRVTRPEYEDALEALKRHRREMDHRLDDQQIDAVLAPAATDVAPIGIDFTGDSAMSLPWSHLGLPAVTIPGLGGAGLNEHPALPLGIQLIGRRNDDVGLLLLAEQIEAQTTL